MTYAPTMLPALKGMRKWLNKWAGSYADSIKIALTEWNFIISPPIHKLADATLASALFAAERLGSMIRVSDSIGLGTANQFLLFNNNPAVTNGLLGYPGFYFRPEGLVFKIFHTFFGDSLVANTVQCERFQQGWRHYPYFPYLAAFSSKSGHRLFLIVVNKDSVRTRPVRIRLEHFAPEPQAMAHILNADSVYATNEQNPEVVTIRDSILTNVSQTFTFAFPAHSVTALELNEQSTRVTHAHKVIRTFALKNSYPNPFRRFTQIGYTLPTDGKVNLTIYNLMGQRVRILTRKFQSRGEHWIAWDGLREDGRPAASGLYFCRIQFAGQAHSQVLLLVR